MKNDDLRFEDIDLDMSSWLVIWRHPSSLLFYLDHEGFITSILSRAKRFRHFDEAERIARERGSTWVPISVPEAMTL